MKPLKLLTVMLTGVSIFIGCRGTEEVPYPCDNYTLTPEWIQEYLQYDYCERLALLDSAHYGLAPFFLQRFDTGDTSRFRDFVDYFKVIAATDMMHVTGIEADSLDLFTVNLVSIQDELIDEWKRELECKGQQEE